MLSSSWYFLHQDTEMSAKGNVTLKNFIIFNATYGPKEGEEEKKIMYYYPKNVDTDTKIKQIGLCEAIVQFTGTFSDQPCESLHTQKHRQILLEPEKNFWVTMTVTVPFTEKTRDGQVYVEYHEEDVQDSVMEAVLKQAYRMFTLFNGSFYHILNNSNGDVYVLQQRLEHFYSRYLLTLRLQQSDILDIYNGIYFLPLDKNTFLQVQCFINILEATFPAIKYTAFLYSDLLVWSGLEQDDMRIMYRYLTTSLFPSYSEQELQAGGSQPSPARTISVPGNSGIHFGKYITGPPNIKDETNLGKIPRVYINTKVDNEDCHLLVYRALNATVCLLLNSNITLNFELCKKLDAFLGPKLSALASEVGEQYSKRPQNSVEQQFKYIYFNHMNLAQKTTVHADLKKSAGVGLPPDILRVLSDVSTDLTKNNRDGETIVRTLSDCWVVGKKSDQREVLIVLNQKNSNLIEITEEVKRLCSTNFSNIFFLE
ncbi:hypothetical protein ACJMK2_035641 [Sinanodonta woodiana]|uniref:Vacuolar fusion protein CCZ1 homolog n=1 Tax=Sinanodonta woodiana TaxID=1069815 RepID=A0ABD3WVJ3_SINWO